MIVLIKKLDTTELRVFDTLIPQDHPGNSWELEPPQRFHNWTAKIYIDHEQQLGVPNRDEPFISDPGQAVLVMQLTNNSNDLVFLIVRTQALIEKARSTHANPRVPWDEWGRDAVVLEDLVRGIGSLFFVHGAQVVVVQMYLFWGQQNYHWSVRTFDFSRRGCSSLPLWGGEGGGTQRTVLSENEGCVRFVPDDGASSITELRSLSDGCLFCLVSCLSQSIGSEAGLIS